MRVDNDDNTVNFLAREFSKIMLSKKPILAKGCVVIRASSRQKIIRLVHAYICSRLNDSWKKAKELGIQRI